MYGIVLEPRAGGAIQRQRLMFAIPSDLPDAPLGDIRASIVYQLRMAYRRLNAVFDAHIAHLGLTPTQYFLLWTIHLSPNMEQAELAEMAGFDSASAGGVLGRLEKLNLIERVPSGRSRRGLAVRTSPEGEALVAEADKSQATCRDEIFAHLSEEERRAFVQLLSKFIGAEEAPG